MGALGILDKCGGFIGLVTLLLCALWGGSAIGGGMSDPDTLALASPGAGAVWQEASGLEALDALCGLLGSPTAECGVAVVLEGGLRERSGPVAAPVVRLDMVGRGLYADALRPGRYPLDLFASRPLLDGDPHWRWRQETGVQVRLPGGFTLTERIVVDADRAADPTARLREYRQLDASVEIPHARLEYARGALRASVGRRWRRWGPGWTGSLLLDAAHPPGDGFDLSYTARRWSARSFYERLEHAPAAAPGESARGRHLAGHRLDLELREGLRLGLSEMALVATEGGAPTWLLNPLLPWVLVQQERGRGGTEVNVLAALDAVWQPAPGWSLYGQFLLDDVQIDVGDRDVYPDQLGWLAGVLWNPGPRSARGLAAGLEYSRLATWTYVHREPDVRYAAWAAPLGHPDGPDAETVSAFGSWRPGRGLRRLVLLARWQRSGRIALDTPELSTGQTGQGFPSPPVQRRVLLGAVLEAAGPLGTVWEGRLNRLAEDGPGRDGWYGSLSVSLPLGPWERRF